MRREARAGWGAALGLGALFGCGSPGGGPLPWPGEAQTALLAVRPGDSDAFTFAVLDGEELVRAEEVALPRGGAAAAAGFFAPPEELQLELGLAELVPLDLEEPCDEVRARPLTSAAFYAETSGAGWTMTTTLPVALRELGLRPLDVGRCYARGGCPDRRLRRCGPCAPVAPPAAPAAPAPVRPARPCPGCSAGPPAALETCPIEQRFDLGSGACVPLGPPCPSGRFPEPSPADPPTVFVDPAASEGGDGSRAAPFADLSVALGAAPQGARILLARGRHDAEGLVLEGWIEGACAMDTVLLGGVRLAGSSTLAHVRMSGGGDVPAGASVGLYAVILDAGPEGLKIAGRVHAEVIRVFSSTAAIAVRAGGEIGLVRAHVEGLPALFVRRGHARAAETVFEGASGDVVRGETSATLELAHTLVASGAGRGVVVVNGSRVSLRDTFVRGGASAERGIVAGGPENRVELARVFVDGFSSSGITASNRGWVEGADVDVRVPDDPSIVFSFGVDAAGGGRLDLSRLRVEGPASRSVELEEAGVCRLEDVDLRGGVGGFRISDTEAGLSRVRVEASQTAGLVTGTSIASLTDLSVEGAGSIGLDIGSSFDDRLRVRVSRARIGPGRDLGISINSISARLSDLEVEGARSGLEVSPGFSGPNDEPLVLSRVRLAENELGFVLDRFNPPLSRLLVPTAITVDTARTGIRLRECWALQGRLFDNLRLEGRIERPISFQSE